MDPRLAAQRKGGLAIIIVIVLLMGMVSGVLIASGLGWIPRTVAETTGETAPGSAAAVDPSEFLIQSQETFRDLVTAVRPAVVSIQATGFDENINNPYQGQIDPFEYFGIPNPFPQGPSGPSGPGSPGGPGGPDENYYMPNVSSGSGFIVSRDGYILTNNHVVSGAKAVKVILDDGRDYEAEVIGNDPDTDVAVLKIGSGELFPYIEMGDSDTIEVGDWAMAIGNPFGNLAGTVTVGIISATGREYLMLPGDTYYQYFIQTDAAINFGNSGGPLIDINGRVIGINTAISSQGSGIGFATPINLAEFVYSNYLEHGEVIRGWIGVTIHNLDADLANALGLDSTKGSIVAELNEGDPAYEGGLREGDVLLEVEGDKVLSTATASRLIAALPVGEPAEFVIWRDGKEMTLEITPVRRNLDGVGTAPEEEVTTPEKNPEGPVTNQNYLGVEAKDLTTEDIAHYELPSGTTGVMVVNVDPRHPAFEKGLRAGSVIVEINGEKVGNLNDYERLMADAKRTWDNEGKTVLLRFLTYGSTAGWVRQFMAVPFE